MRTYALISTLLLTAAVHAGTVTATLTGTATGDYYNANPNPAVPSEYFVDQPFTLVIYGDSSSFPVGGNHRDNPPIEGGSFTLGDISQRITNVGGEDPYTLEVGGAYFGLFERISPYSTLSYSSSDLVGYHYDHDFSVAGLSPAPNSGGEFYQFLSLEDGFVGLESLGPADLSVGYDASSPAPEPSSFLLMALAFALLAPRVYSRLAGVL